MSLKLASEFTASSLYIFFMSLGLISSYKGKKSCGKFIQHFAIKSIATAGNVLVDLFSVTKINLFSSFSHDTQVPGRFSAVDTELKKNRNDMEEDT